MGNPARLIVIGFVLLLIGVALPFLMVTRVLESTFFLNFLAFGCSTVGLIIGFIGIAQYASRRK